MKKLCSNSGFCILVMSTREFYCLDENRKCDFKTPETPAEAVERIGREELEGEGQ